MAAPRPGPDSHSGLESFLSGSTDRVCAFRDLTAAIGRQSSDALESVLRAACVPSLTYSEALALARIQRARRDDAPARNEPVKLAVLGSFTTEPLVSFIELFLFARGVEVEMFESDYGVVDQEILDPQSRLHGFQPDIVFLATSWKDLRHRPGLQDDAGAVRAAVDAELGEWVARWTTLQDQLRCHVIQNGFVPPAWRALGNLEMAQPGSLTRFVSDVNRAMHDGAPTHVTVHDVDQLAAAAGRWRWDAGRFGHHAKFPCEPDHLVDYGHSVASVIAARLGRSRKCLVVDLDGTIWGGVIGEDGPGGIRVGSGDAESEAFVEFQHYVDQLRRRGVILAVCSANDDAIAREPFRQCAEMVLRLEDISCFVANWNDKATNLRAIADQLEIGTDSLVFVDDDPAQRALIRRMLPEVGVPELPDDPSERIEALESHRFFQPSSLGAEDLARTALYRANVERKQSRVAAADLEEFLASLDMTARIEPVHEGNVARVAQLINKTNQFNLTKRHWSPSDVLGVAASGDWVTVAVRLVDRFGDNGLVSVVLARRDGDALAIDTWVMSCRVLRRGLEHLITNQLAAIAGESGVQSIRGEYVPTAKNGLVRDHFERMGFESAGDGPDGQTRWELRLTGGWKPLTTFVREVRDG